VICGFSEYMLSPDIDLTATFIATPSRLSRSTHFYGA
jgi:hypothetical protein